MGTSLSTSPLENGPHLIQHTPSGPRVSQVSPHRGQELGIPDVMADTSAGRDRERAIPHAALLRNTARHAELCSSEIPDVAVAQGRPARPGSGASRLANS